MTIGDHQRQLIDDLAIIDDPQERLAAIVDRARRHPPLPETARTDAHRVRGCQSQVWIAADVVGGGVQFRCDADSPLVKGLVALLCELHSGHAPADIATFTSTLLEELGILQNLSPTRRHGLAAVQAHLRHMALQLAALR